MSNPLKPQSALTKNGQPFYPLTVIDQIMDDNGNRLSIDSTIQVYTHTKIGNVHNFVGNGANGRAKITSDFLDGDKFQVNGVDVAAYYGSITPNDDIIAKDHWVTFIYDGSQLNFMNGNELKGKVDKVDGKGLSTNDYTTEEKNKLAGIDTGANKTVVDSALSSTSTNPVQNKVVNTAITNLNTLVGDTSVSEQITAALSGIEPGAEVNVQSDWDVTDTSSDAYIKHKPGIFIGTNDDLASPGLVPGADPADVEDNYVLDATGTWSDPCDLVGDATTTKHGLMSNTDKQKLDELPTNPNKFVGSNVGITWTPSDDEDEAGSFIHMATLDNSTEGFGVYFCAGTSEYPDTTDTFAYIYPSGYIDGEIHAKSASKLSDSYNAAGTSLGSTTTPVYFSGGVPKACSRSIPAVANNLTTTASGYALDATQGKKLYDMLAGNSNANTASVILSNTDVYVWSHGSGTQETSWTPLNGDYTLYLTKMGKLVNIYGTISAKTALEDCEFTSVFANAIPSGFRPPVNTYIRFDYGVQTINGKTAMGSAYSKAGFDLMIAPDGTLSSKMGWNSNIGASATMSNLTCNTCYVAS